LRIMYGTPLVKYRYDNPSWRPKAGSHLEFFKSVKQNN
jgi:hypothetical protein